MPCVQTKETARGNISMKKAIYCKSFRDDFSQLRSLVSDWTVYGNGIPFLVSVPDSDYKELLDSMDVPENVHIITDESFTEDMSLQKWGWLQQQVCKLSVYQTGFADSYFVIDSDAYLIAPIDEGIFGTDEKPNVFYSKIDTKFYEHNGALKKLLLECVDTPDMISPIGDTRDFSEKLATAILEKKEKRNHDMGSYIRSIFSAPVVATQPSQIFHSHILKSMVDRFNAEGVSLSQLIALSPWEFNWYAYYAMACPEFSTAGIRSRVVHFASDESIAYAKSLGIDEEILKRHFCAVQMAARHIETTRF